MSVDTTNATAGVDPTRAKIAGSIKQAASTTGASFEYLLATAKMESNFNPKAAATTSSARGLFQFIDQTWLGTVKEAGAQLGYGKYADAITRNPSGSYSVSDPDARAAIMQLRDDPDAASSMAAVLTQSNSFKLTGKIGRRPTDAELYMAHFMGVGGAGKLIPNAEDNPNASAARMFPNAAAANHSIFYDRSGQARSVSQVYSVLNSRYDSAANSPATRTAMAAVGGDLPRRVTVASAAPATPAIDNAAYLSSFPDPARRDAGGGDVADRLRAVRADLPLAVPGRRAQGADFACGSGIVGQGFVADFGCVSNLGCAGDLGHRDSTASRKSARRAGSICSAIATARSAAKQLRFSEPCSHGQAVLWIHCSAAGEEGRQAMFVAFWLEARRGSSKAKSGQIPRFAALSARSVSAADICRPPACPGRFHRGLTRSSPSSEGAVQGALSTAVPFKPRRKRRWWGCRDLAASSSMPQAKSICSTSCFSLRGLKPVVGVDISCLISEGIPASDVLGYRAKWLSDAVRSATHFPSRVAAAERGWHDAGRRFGAERDRSRLALAAEDRRARAD